MKQFCGGLYGTVLSLSLSLSVAPPLTVENVMSVVKGVKRWRTLAKQLVGAYDQYDDKNIVRGINLDALQRQHHSDEDCLKTIIERFLEGKPHHWYWLPTWRAVIWCLYLSDEIHLAEQIQSYGEQLEGVCLCMWLYLHSYS